MKKIISLTLLVSSFILFAQDNLTYKAEKPFFKFGKHTYLIIYENSFQPETKESVFSEVIIKGNRRQYISHFIYQLKNSSEMMISPDHPPRTQLENKIIQSSNSEFDYKKEQIIVTTYYYDKEEPKEKEIKTLQQNEKGFFYVIQRQIIYKNGEVKEEKDLPNKIEFVKTNL